ncbi:hypothetical protein VTK73DRAFT_9535 [Phialemonium thermophilum]|uniref:Replication termination factor 2 n=1 Tax=Phialemonium thermophilum TaxID=223376 RepID=A0ABR3XKT8_9PEZI
MGNDGGSIPKRRELVKSASRAPTVSELKATALESLSHAWTHDALNSEPLNRDSVVSDWRGRLYNYETILENLARHRVAEADGESPQSAAQELAAGGGSGELTFASTGIKTLRDIVTLRFKRYVAQPGREIWQCPVSLKELGPATKAVYLVPCGHVFADAGLRTAVQLDDGASETPRCPECSEPFSPDNVIDILPTETADVERLLRRRDSLAAKGLTHSLKKDKSAGKKNKKRKADESRADGEENVYDDKARSGDKGEHNRGVGREAGRKIAVAPESDRADPRGQNSTDMDSRLRDINNPMTASLTAKVLAEQDEQNKRRKLAAAR